MSSLQKGKCKINFPNLQQQVCKYEIVTNGRVTIIIHLYIRNKLVILFRISLGR